MVRFLGSRYGARAACARSWLFAAAAAIVISFATAPAARADSITYSIDVTAFFSGQGSETISGQFAYDTSTDTVTSSDIDVTGANIAGPFTQLYSGDSGYAVLLDSSGDALTLSFTSDLGGATDTVSSIALGIGGPFGFSQVTTIITDDQPISEFSPVPEPSSVVVLGTAAALFGFGRVGPRTKTRGAVEV